MGLTPAERTLIEGAVERICASDELKDADVTRLFLKDILEITLSERCTWPGKEIEAEYYPGVKAGTVRYRATEAREKLTKYYAGSGKNDSVRISLPRQKYRFELEKASQAAVSDKNATGPAGNDEPDLKDEVSTPVSLSEPRPVRQRSRWGWVLCSAAIVLITAAFAWKTFVWDARQSGRNALVYAVTRQQVLPAPRAFNLPAVLAEYADRNGFSREKVEKDVSTFTTHVEQLGDRASPDDQALAQYSKEEFSKASTIWRKEMVATKRSFDDARARRRQSKSQAQRDDEDFTNWLRRLQEAAIKTAAALRADSKYMDARVALEAAALEVDRNEERSLWIDMTVRIANAKIEEGWFGGSRPQLEGAVQDLQMLLEQLKNPEDREQLARLKNSLAVVFIRLGNFAEAQALSREAAQAYSRTGSTAELWGKATYNHGVALFSQAETLFEGSPSDRALAGEIYTKALDDFIGGLGVFTRGPNWAMIQIDRANTLARLGMLKEGPTRLTLFDQAIAVYRGAVAVYDKQGPDWLRGQNGFGGILVERGSELAKDKQTVAEARKSLLEGTEVLSSIAQYAKPTHRAFWAAVENNRGLALVALGKISPGEEGVRLLQDARDAHWGTLEDYKDQPRELATVQDEIGDALTLLAERKNGENKVAIYIQASETYEAALKGFTSVADLKLRDEISGKIAKIRSILKKLPPR